MSASGRRCRGVDASPRASHRRSGRLLPAGLGRPRHLAARRRRRPGARAAELRRDGGGAGGQRRRLGGRQGRGPIEGLRRDDFRLFEDGVEVEIANFYVASPTRPAASGEPEKPGEPASDADAPQRSPLPLLEAGEPIRAVVYLDHIMCRPRRTAPWRSSTLTAPCAEKPLWRQDRRLSTTGSVISSLPSNIRNTSARNSRSTCWESNQASGRRRRPA